MAQLRNLGKYDRSLRADLESLATSMWLGAPADGNKGGNFRGVYVNFTLPATPDLAFAVEHELGEVPLGYYLVGTPTASIVRIGPGMSGSTRLPWTERRIYLQSPETSKEVMLFLWASDSGA